MVCRSVNGKSQLSGINTTKLVELKTGKTFEHQYIFKVKLPAYGYSFFQILARK